MIAYLSSVGAQAKQLPAIPKKQKNCTRYMAAV
jgi:hypothetical protein